MSLKTETAKALISAQTHGDMRDLTPYASAFAGAAPGAGQPAADARDVMLPRNQDDFLGNFGPSIPATISPIDRARSQGMVIPRINQYPVGANLPTPPGATKLIDFRILRQLADVYDVLRACIKVRTQEIASMKWEILPEDEKDTKQTAAIKDLTRFFNEPDPIRGLMFEDWIKVALEEVFVTDALSIYPHTTWLPGRGPLGSDLFALEILDGTTIKPLVDIRGARPLPPNPAYQQFLYGVPRTDLSSALLDAKRQDSNDGENWDSGQFPFSASQLYYRPYHPRVWTHYGFSNVEQIILNVNLALRRQQWHTAYFTDGSIPAGLLHVPEEWNPTQIREYEEGWNSLLGGDTAWKHRVRAVPGTTGFSQLKPPVHDMTFDEWVARITMIGMDVTAGEIGFDPKSGLGGAGWSEQQQNILYRKTLKPITQWIERLLTRIIHLWFKIDTVRFAFIYEEVEDALKKAQEDQILINTGIKTQVEARGERGLDPYPNGLGSEPILITRLGPILLEDINAASKGSVGKNEDGSMIQQQLPAGAVDAQGNPVAPVAGPQHGPVKSIPAGPQHQNEGADMQDPASVASRDPLDQSALNKEAVVAQAEADQSEEVRIDLRRFQTKAVKALRAGRRPVVQFQSEVIPEGLLLAITNRLAEAKTDDDIRRVFSVEGRRGAALLAFENELDAELALRV